MVFNLQNDKYYPLSILFSTANRKIIIPDFQRDYCWGDEIYGDKKDTAIVANFIDTLIDEFNQNIRSDVYLGKIDVYEYPKNHIYLTDGQQRLTSLYLLLGMLYRTERKQEQKDIIKKCLISDFELYNDDKEPYLQYAVRESTIFFLRDLVNEFFINDENLKVENINSQSWFFNEYILDPSINSILSTLKIIEDKKLENLNVTDFTNFVLNHVQIQYHDVKDKKHGEERFVIINTTGKSLTTSENIKPILLASLTHRNYADEWEKREDFFWKNRSKDKEDIADFGVDEFLLWCFQIADQQDDINTIKKAKELLKKNENEMFLLTVQKYFGSLKLLLNYLEEEKFQTQFIFITKDKSIHTISDLREKLNVLQKHNILFPLLAYLSKVNDRDNDLKEGAYLLLRRLRKNYFDNIWEDRKVNYIDWRYVLQIIEKSNSIDVILQFDTNKNNLKIIQNVQLNSWYNEDEQIKTKLK